eukprot:TRINITY_DN6753_c0_g1_i1.p1 TRINITY_DN6753_c0_g1~~TRINITY_DN6753_c0_g1_i1.p1  ORF type:complete len:473 (+),score=72.55 TRINITY_DN6753_c0_g1_i1:120-1538(+)
MAEAELPAAASQSVQDNDPVELLLSLKQASPTATPSAPPLNNQASGDQIDTSPKSSVTNDDEARQHETKAMTGAENDNNNSSNSTSSGSEETELPSSSSDSANKSNDNDEEYVPPSERRASNHKVTGAAKRPSGVTNKPGRNNLPKEVTAKLKTWFFDHADHPYPNEEKKMELANECSLTIMQINNWFINARRRLISRPPKRGSEHSQTTCTSKSAVSSQAPATRPKAKASEPQSNESNSHSSSVTQNKSNSSDEDPTLNQALSSSGSDKASSGHHSHRSITTLVAQNASLKEQVQAQQLQILQQQAVIQAMKTQQALMPNAMMMPEMNRMYNPMMANSPFGGSGFPNPMEGFNRQDAIMGNGMPGVNPMSIAATMASSNDAMMAIMAMQKSMGQTGAMCTSGMRQGTKPEASLTGSTPSPFMNGYPFMSNLGPSMNGGVHPATNPDWQTMAGFHGPFSGQPNAKRPKDDGS